MTKEIYSVPTNQIAISPDMQVRTSVDGERVARYAADIAATLLHGEKLAFPPIELYKVDDPVLGEELWLVEGFHRFYAYQEAGLSEHDCIITEGTRKEAIERALTANYVHDKNGIGLTKDERLHAMSTLYELNKDEIGFDTSKLIDLVMKLGVSIRSANRDTLELRNKIKAKQEREAIRLINEDNLSVREAAARVGMTKSTLSRVAKNYECPNSANGSNGTVTEIIADDDEIVPVFGDEELEAEEVVNPMDDFNKKLAEREARKSSRNDEDTTVTPNDYDSVMNNVSDLSTETLIDELSSRLLKTSKETVVMKLQSNPEMAEQFSLINSAMTRIMSAIS